MINIEAIEKISKKYSNSPDDFIRRGSTLAIKERKANLQMERLDIIARYEVATVAELEDKIKDGKVPEHPAWEDLIEIKNIEAEIKEIENDLETLQQP